MFENVDCLLVRVLLNGCVGQLFAEHGHEKAFELDVAFGSACCFVDRCIGVGVVAADTGELVGEAILPRFEFSLLLGRGIRGRVGIAEDEHGLLGSLLEEVAVVLLLGMLGRFGEIARVGDFVHLLFTLLDDFAIGRTEVLLSGDDSVFDDCAVDVGDWEVELCCCHGGAV